jgi:hypothetical protein
MKTVRLVATTALLFCALSIPAAAQVGITAHAGTLGIGGELSIGVLPVVALRAGGNIQPWDPKLDFDDIEYTIDLASPSWFGVVDLYLAGPLRLSGGAVMFSNDTQVTGKLTQNVDIGDASYTPQQVGTLSGVFEAKKLAPYAGIGFGKAPRTSGLGFAMDLGVAWHGDPGVRLSADGPIASDPTFQANLAREEANIEDDAKSFRFYPVVSVGFVVAF